MSVLATALSGAMGTSTHDLVVFDKDADTWTRHPWPQVLARAEGRAEVRLLDSDGDGLADRAITSGENGVTGFVDTDGDGRWDVKLTDADGDGAADAASALAPNP